MPKKSDIPLEQKPIRLFAGDFARLNEMYPDLGATSVIRTLVRAHIKRVDAAVAPLDIELPTGQLEELLP